MVLETAFSDVPSGPKACSDFCRAPGQTIPEFTCMLLPRHRLFCLIVLGAAREVKTTLILGVKGDF